MVIFFFLPYSPVCLALNALLISFWYSILFF